MLENERQVLEESLKALSPVMLKAGKGAKIAEIGKQLVETRKSSTTLLVCGEFKRGKSTFINALLGRKVCATDIDICTSVVSIIKYGEKEKVVRHYGDLDHIKEEEIPFDELKDYTVGSAQEIGNTIWVEISLLLEKLKAGLVLIDTPGVGGLDPRHAMLTKYFLPQADVAIFMTDVNEPVTTTELDFYKNKVLPYASHSAIIVNKADLKEEADVADILKDTTQKIANYTQTDAQSLHILPVSSRECIDQEEGLGNFPALWDMLMGLAEEFQKEKLVAIRDLISDQISFVLTPLQAQLSAIESPDINQIKELTEQKNEMERRVIELKDPSSEFRLAVNQRMMTEKTRITSRLNELCVQLSTEVLDNLLNNEKADGDNGGEWLGQQISDAIDAIGAEIKKEMDRSFAKIASMEEFEGMLKFSNKKYQGDLIVRHVDTALPLHRRITSLGSGLGASVLASCVGLAAIPVVGTALVVATGLFVAFSTHKDTANTHLKTELRKVYGPQITVATNNLRSYVDTRFQDFNIELLKTVTDRVHGYSESLKEAVLQVEQTKKDINAAVTKKAGLQKLINSLLAEQKKLEAVSL